eukprot:gene14802-17938_t
MSKAHQDFIKLLYLTTQRIFKYMLKTKEEILNSYQNHILVQQNLIQVLGRKLNNISFSRLGLFVAELLIVALMIQQGFHWIFSVLLFIPVLLFLVQVKKQVKVQQELEYAKQLLWIFQNEEDQVLRHKNGYSDGKNYEQEQHPYASDLDIYGPASLYSLLNRCKTVKAQDLLARHLGAPLSKSEIEERQAAIEELGGHIDDTFHFRAKLQAHQPEQLRNIERKLVHELPLQLHFIRHRFLKSYGAYAGIFFALLLLFNAGLTFLNLSRINQVYLGFSGSASLLKAFSGTIAWTEGISWKSAYILQFFKGVNQQVSVSAKIKKLSSIIQDFDARLNLLVASFLNLCFLWDLRCCLRLSKWYEGSSEQILQGLYRISQFEELICFATLKYNEPSWQFPVIRSAFGLKAKSLGHPLIEEKIRVANDFELQPQATVDVVTGSNMAGKSTFLRTVGINMVLAYVGAPVCAAELSLSIFSVLSYMRIKDSLNDQTSTFKAELNRLKMILSHSSEQENAFVLIDEMLRGTNSRDKYLGSKVFIQKMIKQHTPALFATHDLQLSEMVSAYPEQLRNYHFDIQITEHQMHFDYRLKHGPCKTFNAAILLKQIGLSLTDEETT